MNISSPRGASWRGLSALFVLCLLSTLSTLPAHAQAPDPTPSSKVLDLTTFATFTTRAGSGAIDLDHPDDGTGRVFVSTNEGKIFGFTSGGQPLGVFLDLAATGGLPDFDPSLVYSMSGLTYIAFHPDYGRPGAAGEGKLYTTAKVLIPGRRGPDYSAADLPTRPGNNHTRYAITEWTVSDANPDRVDPSTQREVIRFEISSFQEPTHSVGDLLFDPFTRPGEADHGLLHIPLGDMSAGAAIPNLQHVQSRDNPFGKILRIDPLVSGGDPYSVPPDNPFADGGPLLDADGNVEEIFAWGLRNPQNLVFARDDNGASRLVAFDIGAGDYEEVNLVDPADNHGWPRRDGPTVGNPNTTLLLPPFARLEPPAAVYDHDIPNVPGAPPTEGAAAVTGGFVVSDPGDPSFRDQLLFGDLPRGAFFHMDFDALVAADRNDTQAPLQVMAVRVDGGAPGAFPPQIGSFRGDARFGDDESGRVFVVSRQVDRVFLTGQVTEQTLPAPEDDPFVLLLGDGRFRVTVDWRTTQGTSGAGHAVPLTEDSGYFWFFDENNVELVVKVLDACVVNDRFWVFAAGLTNVAVEITVVDTQENVTRVYRNPQETPFQPVQDTDAFATCP